ncbi:MAG: GAF domain-containing protein, partial [Leptospiraceae bacterium]|nr:GAF domain-containing protein [Leptospiraceae bacterium]
MKKIAWVGFVILQIILVVGFYFYLMKEQKDHSHQIQNDYKNIEKNFQNKEEILRSVAELQREILEVISERDFLKPPRIQTINLKSESLKKILKSSNLLEAEKFDPIIKKLDSSTENLNRFLSEKRFEDAFNSYKKLKEATLELESLVASSKMRELSPFSFGWFPLVVLLVLLSTVYSGFFFYLYKEEKTKDLQIQTLIEEKKTDAVIKSLISNLTNVKSREEFLKVTLEHLRETFEFRYASFWRYDPKDKKLKFEFDSGDVSFEFKKISETSTFEEGVGLNGRALTNRDVFITNNLAEMNDCVRAPAARKAGIQSAIAFPIIVGERKIGTLDLLHDKSIQFSKSQIESFRVLQRIIGEQLQKLEQNLENVRIKVALDNVSTNVLIANNKREIIYANKSVIQMFNRGIEEIKKQFSNFETSTLIGRSMDDFHKNPKHQAEILASFQSEHKTKIQIGSRHFSLIANPIIDSNGERLGSVVEWADVTNETLVQQEIDQILKKAILGDFSARINLNNKEGFFLSLSESINKLLEITLSGILDVAKVLEKTMKGDLTQRVEKDYSGIFGDLKAYTNSTITKLSEILQRVNQSVTQVFEAAKQVSMTSQSISQAASEQAASVQEISASLEEMNASISQNA